MNLSETKAFLEEKADLYNTPGFADCDPVFVPHQFSKKEDIEISGFLAATLSWGKRETIRQNALRLIERMDNSPYDYVMGHTKQDLRKLSGFVHRTFQATDARFFVASLKNIYEREGGMEALFSIPPGDPYVIPAINRFHSVFFSIPHPLRTRKHVSLPAKGSPAKRINMFLRWMVRKDNRGVDLGLWSGVRPAQLSCPLDIHSGNVARKLGLITCRQNNLKALNELDTNLRKMDPADPVKYDFALFGLGFYEGF